MGRSPIMRETVCQLRRNKEKKEAREAEGGQGTEKDMKREKISKHRKGHMKRKRGGEVVDKKRHEA